MNVNGIFILKKTMTLPTISFKEFAKNPIVALLFMCIMVIGYLHVKHVGGLENTISELRKDVDSLKKENKELYDILIKINENYKK